MFDDPDGAINPCRFDADSYNYFGWALPDEDFYQAGTDMNDPAIDQTTVLSYINPLMILNIGQITGPFHTAWESTGDIGEIDKDSSLSGLTVYRLKEGIERFFITDINNPAGSATAQSQLFVMWDDAALVLAKMGPRISNPAAAIKQIKSTATVTDRDHRARL